MVYYFNRGPSPFFGLGFLPFFSFPTFLVLGFGHLRVIPHFPQSSLGKVFLGWGFFPHFLLLQISLTFLAVWILFLFSQLGPHFLRASGGVYWGLRVFFGPGFSRLYGGSPFGANLCFAWGFLSFEAPLFKPPFWGKREFRRGFLLPKARGEGSPFVKGPTPGVTGGIFLPEGVTRGPRL